jgi:hypothetical protein
MSAIELVSAPEESLRLRAQCEEIIDTGKRLPDFVFRRPFTNYYAVEYAHLYKGKFGQLLHELSRPFGDDSLSYMMLDPEPWEGVFFGLVSFTLATLTERYSQVMSPTQSDTHILAGANLGVFWGSSLRWAVFADRISWELALIAADKDFDVPGILGWPCFGPEQIRSYMTSQYQIVNPSGSIAAEFCKKFLSNYSI